MNSRTLPIIWQPSSSTANIIHKYSYDTEVRIDTWLINIAMALLKCNVTLAHNFFKVKWLLDTVKSGSSGELRQQSTQYSEKVSLDIQHVSLTQGLKRLNRGLNLDSLRHVRSVYKLHSIYHVNTRLLANIYKYKKAIFHFRARAGSWTGGLDTAMPCSWQRHLIRIAIYLGAYKCQLRHISIVYIGS